MNFDGVDIAIFWPCKALWAQRACCTQAHSNAAGRKRAYPYGLRSKPGHSALLGIRLEAPNLIPRALIDPVWISSDNTEIHVNRP